MNFPANPLTPATKDRMQSHLSKFHALMQHSMNAAGKMNVLNMAATKASMKDSMDLMLKMFAAPEFGKAVAILHAETQPAADKANSYFRHASEIQAHAQSEVAQTVQDHMHEALDHLSQMIDTLAKTNQQLYEGYHQQLIAFVDHVAPAPMPAKPAKNMKADKDMAVAA